MSGGKQMKQAAILSIYCLEEQHLQAQKMHDRDEKWFDC
uniref:Uncharacterized protein n=1 Tax=Anguilla anguilla TaxID=7936 RepID=A0A0E9W926_ANGAN